MDDSLYKQLDIGQWAWEFLRRNPEYQSDYDEFIATWHALEAEYGAPPNRDFFRWKKDPRASRPAWDPGEPLIGSSMNRVYTKNAQMRGARRRSYWTYEAEERNAADGHFSRKPFGARLSGRSALSRRLRRGSPFTARRFVHPIPESQRRVHEERNQRFPSTGAACVTDDEDRQLIECWIGAKWGFYQFPQHPDLSALQLTTPINWRPSPGFDLRSEDNSPIRLKLNFDLSLPLPAQLDAARQWLIGEQTKLRRQGQPVPWSLENRRDYWRELIEVLDKGDSNHSAWNKAIRMTQGYREILHLRRDKNPEP